MSQTVSGYYQPERRPERGGSFRDRDPKTIALDAQGRIGTGRANICLADDKIQREISPLEARGIGRTGTHEALVQPDTEQALTQQNQAPIHPATEIDNQTQASSPDGLPSLEEIRKKIADTPSFTQMIRP